MATTNKKSKIVELKPQNKTKNNEEHIQESMKILWLTLEAFLNSTMPSIKEILNKSGSDSVESILYKIGNLKSLIRSISLPIVAVPTDSVLYSGDSYQNIKNTVVAQSRLLWNSAKAFNTSIQSIEIAANLLLETSKDILRSSKEKEINIEPNVINLLEKISNSSVDDLLHGVLGPFGLELSEDVRDIDNADIEPGLLGFGLEQAAKKGNTDYNDAYHLQLLLDIPALRFAVSVSDKMNEVKETELDDNQLKIHRASKVASYYAIIRLCRMPDISPESKGDELKTQILNGITSKIALMTSLKVSSKIETNDDSNIGKLEKECDEYINSVIKENTKKLVESIESTDSDGKLEQVGLKLVTKIIGDNWLEDILNLAVEKSNVIVKEAVKNANQNPIPR